MRLSKKSRYGLRALIDLTVNSKSNHVALNCIAERNNISPQYLEQVFAGLRKAGIVKSIKGPQGGYFLAEDAEKITVAEILEALDGDYWIENEEITDQTPQAGILMAIQELLIDSVNEKLDEVLKALTLADLEKYYIRHSELDTDMYYI